MRVNNKVLLGSLFASFLFLTGCSLSSVSDSVNNTMTEVGSELSSTGSAVSDSVSSTGSSISDYFGTLFGGSE